MTEGEFPPVAVVRTVAEVRAQVAAYRAAGLTVALVPTMGALHDGHLSLVRRGGAVADRVVVSIFVNPTQFGPNDDFDRYPRLEDQDRRRLGTVGTSLLFAPGVAEMYPSGSSTTVIVAGVSDGLCGDFRPGHFAGVATVVTKLLLQVLPDVALFGEKDYQQLQVIRRLVRDLDIPVRVEGVPTMRESDGLAMSSRNAYLSADERTTAAVLYATLRKVAAAVASGADVTDTCAAAVTALTSVGYKVDYLDVRDAESLAPIRGRDTQGAGRVIAAAWLGRTRLIDNIALEELGREDARERVPSR